MPSIRDPAPISVHQLLHAPSDEEYLDNLITLINDAHANKREYALADALRSVSQERESEIERLCNTHHQDFVTAVERLVDARKGTVHLSQEILDLSEAIQTSTEQVVQHKKALVDSRDVRQNIDEANQALQLCLEVLGLANKVTELLRQKKHYAALRTLDELQNVHLKEVVQFDVADLVQRSVPSMKLKVKEAVWTDLTAWLYRIRESSQLLGQVAFDQTEHRRRRQKERVEKSPYLEMFKLNSAIELVLDEREEYDVLRNENINIDFTPLFECLHIHEAMEELDEFKQTYSDTRRQQKDLLVPTTLSITDEDTSAFNVLLENIAGFAIIERSTVRKAAHFRTSADVDELWDSLSKKAMKATTPALAKVTTSGTLLKIKNVLALFIQTLDTYGYSVEAWDKYLQDIFKQYSALLKSEFVSSFNEIVAADDYVPMRIDTPEEYDSISDACWYTPDEPPYEFPTTLPFSAMYPDTCRNIREFLNKYYYFADDYFSSSPTSDPASGSSLIDTELRSSLDTILTSEIAPVLLSRLSSAYLGQIVQILINLSHFSNACIALESFLSSAHPEVPTHLTATSLFRTHIKTAEKRIFELVNQKIDDLVETAEYNWASSQPTLPPQTSEYTIASAYLRQATMFLESIMSSTLVTLPRDIKGLIYFDALNHLSASILSLLTSDSVYSISRASIEDLKTDVDYLLWWTREKLDDEGLVQVFEELRQTVELMAANNPDEFYDINARMKKYSNVDPLNGPVLLEKVLLGEEQQQAAPRPVVQEKTSTVDRAKEMARGGLARFR